MADRMDQLIALAVRQGFRVWQTKTGGWVFRRGIVTVTARRLPETGAEWMDLVRALRGAGLNIP